MATERPPRIADQAVRERVARLLDESQIVEASAGTGKTRILVDRLIEVVASGAGELSGCVVVTFTEKAAGELKLRVREAIEHGRQAASDERRGRLDAALEQLEEAHISTIHGFCADLLREHPVEAGVDPDFAVHGEELSGLTLFEAVFARWLDDQRRALPPGLRRVLRRRPRRGTAAGQLLGAARTLVEHRDLPARWELIELDLAAELSRFVDEQLLPFAEAAREAVDRGLLRLEKLLSVLTLAEEIDGGVLADRDPERLEARLWALRLDRWLYVRRGPAGAAFEQRVDAFRAAHDELRERIGAELAARLQHELCPCLERYERGKRETGQLDFLDLLLRTRELLARDAGVRATLQRRFSHVFIDEFQDTDPLQAEILLLLCADDPAETSLERLSPRPGKLFLVGDPKQSIYRFRRADVRLYHGLRARLLAQGAATELSLTTSFRAVPELQRAINAAFAPLLDGQGGEQARYAPLLPFREDRPEQPALVALPVPKPFGRGRTPRVTKKAVRASEPDAVAAWIDWLLRQSDYRVSTRRQPEADLPLAPHHICLLFRQLRGVWEGDLTRPYVEALERRGVPHVVVGGRSFFAREEVEAAIAALRVIEWPGDELSVFAALRGPLFGFDDETLLHYRRAGGRFHARAPGELDLSAVGLERLDQGEKEADQGAEGLAGARALAARVVQVREALEQVLGKLHAGRNHRPLAETVSRLLGQTRCLGGFALRPNGEQAVASLLRLQELARRFQRSDALSFRGFVDYLESQLEADLADADMPLVEEGAGGVRIMSVHRAKGLEFPVVILADAACSPSTRATQLADRKAGLFAAPLCGCVPRELSERQEHEDEREQAEERRLLYVAATRARDMLVIPTLPEDAEATFDESWLSPLTPVLAARDESTPSSGSTPTASAIAAGVTAGWHTPRVGDHRVYWADLSTLSLAPPAPRPLKDWDLIKAEGARYARSLERYGSWREARQARIEAGSRLGWQAQAATEVAHHGGLFSPQLLRDAREVSQQRVAAPGATALRRGEDARNFGTLVHGVLELVDPALASDRTHVEAVARLCSRLGPPVDGHAAAEAAQRAGAALSHPLMLRAASAEQVFREVPLSLRVDPPGEPPLLIEGIVDLVFREVYDSGEGPRGRWVVVDYKSDVEPSAEHIAAYRRQVAFYVQALREISGEEAEGHLLFV
jgi:ATP-dependent helicase/nuclease subunit A